MKNATCSGDGRFDSMGHSAKYGAYPMFCNSISKIVHYEIRQVGIFFMCLHDEHQYKLSLVLAPHKFVIAIINLHSVSTNLN